MELTKFLTLLAVILPVAYGAPTQAASDLHPQILEAMKRDLGLNTEQATARVARDMHATNIIQEVRISVGDSFAGGWIDADVLHIGITDQALADKVTAAGATPIVMANSLSKLEKAKADLDKAFINQANVTASGTSSGIASYFVDVAANKVIIEALADSHGHAKGLASQVRLAASEFQVRTVEIIPTTVSTVQGGDEYRIDKRFGCSVGFAVTAGFVSAGHCGKAGSSATTKSGEALGTFSGSTFPGNADIAYIKTVGGTVLKGSINGYGHGSSLPVSGSSEAAIGASICRSGAASQVHCGTVISKDATVHYKQGPVSGLTGASVCAEHGDSGGSFYSGSQAQGVTSGTKNASCSDGGKGTTYFQPINKILQTYGLHLVTDSA
ncbi:Chymotrypsin [Metarhizium anisopliae]